MLVAYCLDLIVKAVLSSLRQPTCNITIAGYSKANYLSKSFRLRGPLQSGIFIGNDVKTLMQVVFRL
jgi:hypothetical protein